MFCFVYFYSIYIYIIYTTWNYITKSNINGHTRKLHFYFYHNIKSLLKITFWEDYFQLRAENYQPIWCTNVRWECVRLFLFTYLLFYSWQRKQLMHKLSRQRLFQRHQLCQNRRARHLLLVRKPFRPRLLKRVQRQL